jgi:peptide/nickel transport system permease protein
MTDSMTRTSGNAREEIASASIRRPWSKSASLNLGLGLLFLYAALFAAAPWVAPYGPLDMDIPNRLQGPSGAHWLGTDQLGRDVLSRVLHAGRIDLFIGVTAVVPPYVIGVLLGLVAGYRGGWVQTLVMRGADIVMAFPYYVLVIALVFALGPGAKGIYVAIALVGWSSYARIMHGEVAGKRRAEYVLAAQAGGLSHARVMFVHLLPNAINQSIVFATSDIVVIILSVVALSFLGLGLPPPAPEWGAMISDARPFIQSHPYLMIAPGVAVAIAGLAFSLIGDGLAVLSQEARKS